MSPSSPHKTLLGTSQAFWLSVSSRKACLEGAPPSPLPPSPPTLDEVRQDFMRVLTSLSVFSTKTLQAAVRSHQMRKHGSLFNLFTGKEIPLDYHFDAHVRSYLYELSPSSCQYWRKCGRWCREAEHRPTGLVPVNSVLGQRNSERGWCVRSGGGTRGLWSMKNVDEGFGFHPLPAAHQRVSGRVGRRKPKRNT